MGLSDSACCFMDRDKHCCFNQAISKLVLPKRGSRREKSLSHVLSHRQATDHFQILLMGLWLRVTSLSILRWQSAIRINFERTRPFSRKISA